MNYRLGMFVKATKAFAKSKIAATRKLYTDHIYPYPQQYINNELYPTVYRYRETFKDAPWDRNNALTHKWGFRMFWTYWWYMLFKNPHVILGHEEPPDPFTFSDEELGIPPDDFGSYEEWIESRMQENSA